MVLPDFVEVYGLDDWEASILALEGFTQQVSAEFAIRPFIVRYPERTLAQMLNWAGHEHPGVRRLASEVCLTEERERRRIAEDLHDHLGQALALLKLRLQRLRGDAVLGGHGDALGELVTISNQAIRYTRGLTFELSPPVLYELGLGPALDWLGEQTVRKHGLKVKVRDHCRVTLPDDLKVMLWKSARELLHNVIKHAEARQVELTLEARDGRVTLTVTDDGVGFDFTEARRHAGDRFGLFSIEERLRQLGGCMTVDTAMGRGTRVSLESTIPEGDA